MAKLLLLRPDIGIVESSGLVSRWDDQSGQGNWMRQDTAANKPQYSGGAIVFDGVDDWMYHNDVVDTSFGNFGTGDFTISVRMQHNPLNTYDQFCSKGSQAAGNFVFGFWADGSKINFGTNSAYLTDPASITAGKYYVATIVRKGDAGYLYVDGKLVASNATYFASQNISNASRFAIGARSSTPDHFLAGAITDVSVDDVALTQNDIKSYIAWINRGRKGRGFAGFNKFGGL